MRRRIAIAVGLTAMLAWPLPAPAVDVQVGGVPIVIPDPPRQTALKNGDSPFYKMHANAQQRINNRILAVFSTATHAAQYDAGALPDSTQWAVAAVRYETPMTNADFNAKVVPAIAEAALNLVKDPELRRRIDAAREKALEEVYKEAGVAHKPKFEGGAMHLLGVYTRGPRHVTYGIAMTNNVDGLDGRRYEVPLVGVISAVNVRDRIVFATLNRRYNDERDITAARQDALAWADAIVKANP